MKCVHYDYKSPDSFEEQLNFSQQMPYTIRVKKFTTEELVPLHYGRTMEILICSNLTGVVVIDGQTYEFHGNQVFVIPPYTLHSTKVEVCSGTQFVLKVSFNDLEKLLNIPLLAAADGLSIEQFSYQCPDFDTVNALVMEMIDQDGDSLYCISCLLRVFHILSHYLRPQSDDVSTSKGDQTAELRKLIKWTQNNHRTKVKLEDVAALTGYSKFYFCSWFKEATGMTYFNYLHLVRLESACRILQRGASVTEACFESGFENVSYFIQTFKRVYGVTPKQYLQRLSLNDK